MPETRTRGWIPPAARGARLAGEGDASTRAIIPKAARIAARRARRTRGRALAGGTRAGRRRRPHGHGPGRAGRARPARRPCRRSPGPASPGSARARTAAADRASGCAGAGTSTPSRRPRPRPRPPRARRGAVHADVDDDARGAQRVRIEHAHQVAVVLEVPQLLHEPLRVERPALTVPADPAPQPAPAVERAGEVGDLAALQVMARNALVVDGRGLAPGREALGARRYRPPHLPRAGEVLRRRGVIAGTGSGRSDPAAQGPHRTGDVEVGATELVDGAVRDLLHPV